jgi:hypothetical protein
MTRPTRLEINCETGEQTFIELTNAEIEANEAAAAAYIEQQAADQKAAKDKEVARQAVYKKLGLTADEVAALLG